MRNTQAFAKLGGIFYSAQLGESLSKNIVID